MATRYWVGSGGGWSDPANWSATSGGAGGASVPTSVDDAIFNASSGSCGLDVSPVVRTITIGTGYVSTITGGGVYSITTAIASGTALVLTPGTNAAVNVAFSVEATAGNTVNINVNLANIDWVNSQSLSFTLNPTVATSTVSLITNGNFTQTASSWLAPISMSQGTFTTGTVNPTIGYLYGSGGTYNFNASTVTLLSAYYSSRILLDATAGNITVNLGTSTINGATSGPAGYNPEFLINANPFYGFTSSVTTSAGQVLNVYKTTIGVNVSGAQTLRTVTARTLDISLGSGTNLTAGAVTANEYFTLNAYPGYSVLPTFTASSITGTNSTASFTYIQIYDPGFSCGAITLSYTGTGGSGQIYYQEESKGTVNVTGAVTLSSTDIVFVSISSKTAFSGAPTVTYAALNASVKGSVYFYNERAVTATTITTSNLYVLSSANVTVGAVTLGGTLSSVVYDGTFDFTAPAGSCTFQASSFARGTGANTFLTAASGGFTTNINITGSVTCTYFDLFIAGSFTIGGTLTCVNDTYPAVYRILGASSVSLAAVSISGLANTESTGFTIGDSTLPNCQIFGNVTVSGAITLGSTATNRFNLNIDASGAINLSGAVTHSMQCFNALNFSSLTFAASSTLTLNPNSAITYPANPLNLQSAVATSISLRGITCTFADIASYFYVQAGGAAVTFNNSPTMGAATATRCWLQVDCASFTCPAIETSGYYVNASGAVTQSGLITISGTAISNPQTAVYISAGGTSTIAGATLASITDTAYTSSYYITLDGAGAFTISGAITGPTAVDVYSAIIITKTNTTTFSGTISNIRDFVHNSGNLVFTGALAISVRYLFQLTSGFTVTPNTSVITISGTSTSPTYENTASLDHGGYTLNSVVFPATARKQLVYNTSNSTGLTVTNFSSTGAAVPNSYLELGTDLTVTGSQLTIAPNSITNRHLVRSDQWGVARTITAATRTINTGVDFQDITAAGGVVPWNLFTLSAGDAGGNTNITFPTAVTRYAVNTGTVNWDSTATWSATAGGATGATVPLAHDTVVLSGSPTISTNGRVFLGSNTNFGSFSGSLTVTVDSAIFIGSTDMSLVPNTAVITATSPYELSVQGRSAITFSPPACAIGCQFNLVGTSNITAGGPNDLVVTNVLTILGNTFNTNTGSRICNITAATGLQFGGTDLLPNGFFNLTSASNLNSSTVTCSGNLGLNNCSGTTAQISSSAGNISITGATSFTNATISAAPTYQISATSANLTLGTSQLFGEGVFFNAASVLNSSAATINVKTIFSSAAAWTEGTTQIIFKPESTTSALTLNLNDATLNSVVNKVSFDDSSSGLAGSATFSLTSTFGGITSVRQFDSSLLSRPLSITGSLKVGGGLGSVFSNKGWTYLNTLALDQVLTTEPLYIPYAFCSNVTVGSGAVVAYGPANLSGNTGNITFPSRLRYYAFVATATTMTVPGDYNGMGLMLAVGGGATPSSILTTSSRGGGGGGGTAYTFAFPINHPTNPVVPGQTLYVNAGNYAVAPIANSSGGNGFSSWINVSSNSTPLSSTVGAYATGGSTTTSTSGGAGGTIVAAHFSILGSPGGTALSSTGGGGGGSSLFSGGSPSTEVGGGGGGTISAGSATGQGGDGSVTGGAAGVSGAPATPGTAGASATGAGGGGGGGNTATGTYTPGGSVTVSTITRANTFSTMIFTLNNHGYVTGDILDPSAITALKTGTWSKAPNTSAGNVTVNISSHGLIAGDIFFFLRTSGSIVPSAVYTVVSATTNSFTFTYSASSTASSGSCSLGQSGLSVTSTYSITVLDQNRFSIVSSASTVLSSGQIEVAYQLTSGSISIYKGKNGGSGALNSSQQFIRFYNGVYTPGYFGIGAGGGGGGSVVNTSSNSIGQGGSGGDGGIGSGGGGAGRPGNSRQGSSSTATSGRGGPGLVMFIYAVRRNNMGMVQGL